jgi:integrase
LNVRSFNNLYDWKYHFEDFKEWLREIKPLKVKKDRLAKNTQNKCIKALNRFMAWAYQTNVLTELQPKCEVYAREELPQIGAEDLYTKEEQKMLIEALRVIRPISADFFMFLNNSGCRLNEGLGVCPPFVVEGQIDGDHSKRIHDKLKVYGMDRYYGYIVLMNQPELDSVRLKGNKDFKSSVTGKVWEAEQVPRKPLKHRKNDRPEDWRYIPIYDKATWNMLVDRWNEQDALLQKKARGRNPNDYLLFDGLTASMFYVDLMKAVAQVKLRFRSPHKCRHTYLSWFYAETDEDPFLAKKVGGHKDQGSRAIYSHISQQIGLEQKFVIQMTKKMRRVD